MVRQSPQNFSPFSSGSLSTVEPLAQPASTIWTSLFCLGQAKHALITQFLQSFWFLFFTFLHGLLLHFLVVFLSESSSLSIFYKMTNPTKDSSQNSLFSLIYFIGTYSCYYMEHHILKKKFFFTTFAFNLEY